MPTTTCTGPPASARISMRMPPSLPARVTRSLGHLRPTSVTPSSRSAFDGAQPTTRLSADRSAGMSAYCHASERQMAPPGGATQPRPRRPRPPVWCSASTTAGARAAGGSDSSSRVFVDSSVHSTSNASMRARTSRGSAASMRSADSALTPACEAITLVGLRVERDAELAQLLDGLPHGGARHLEIGGQRLAGLEVAVVEALEHALRQRHRHVMTGRARTATERRARGSVPLAHAAHVAAMRVDHERGAGQRETELGVSTPPSRISR